MIAFWLATANPITRFPLFLMGMYAGLLSHRHPVTTTEAEEDPFPWPKSFLGLLPYFNPCTTLPATRSNTSWARIANFQSIWLLTLTLAVFAGDTALKVRTGYHGVLLGPVWFQSLIPFAQLEVIVALTRDGGVSLASRAFRTPVAVWLGNISAALYLIHFVVKDFIVWATRGFVTITDPDDCRKYVYNSGEWWYCYFKWQEVNHVRSLELWAMPIMVVVSLLAAAIIYYYFEEPIRVVTKRSNAAIRPCQSETDRKEVGVERQESAESLLTENQGSHQAGVELTVVINNGSTERSSK